MHPRIASAGFVVLSSLLLMPAFGQPIMQSKVLPIYTRTVPESRQPAGRTAALIQELSAPPEGTRMSAQRTLAAMGPKVEPELRWAMQREEAALQPERSATKETIAMPRGSVEVRYRPFETEPRPAFHALSVLLKRCEEADHARPDPVTLQFDDTPATEVLQELGRQVNADVSFHVQSWMSAVKDDQLDWFRQARITVHVDHVPYWSAMREIVRKLPPPPHPDPEQFLTVGSNYDPLSGQRENGFIASDVGTIPAGFFLLHPTFAGPPERFTMRAVVNPAITGVTGVSRLQLDQVLDAHGNSLLRVGQRENLSAGVEDKDRDPRLGYEFNPSGSVFAWRQIIDLSTPADTKTLSLVRGQFSLGVGPPSQPIGIPLSALHVDAVMPRPNEREIYLTEDCQQVVAGQLQARPYTSKPASFCNLKHVPHAREGDIDTQETDLRITNADSVPVTFVVWKMMYGQTPVFTQPDQVSAYTWLYRAHAAPGETVSIRMDVRLNYKQRSVPPPDPLSLPVPQATSKSTSADFDGWRLSATSVGRDGMLYTISGQLSAPEDAPISPQYSFLYLRVADQSRWPIDFVTQRSQFRHEQGRLVQDFIMTTREPGRVPASLVWTPPAATHWLTEPFELHDLQELPTSPPVAN